MLQRYYGWYASRSRGIRRRAGTEGQQTRNLPAAGKPYAWGAAGTPIAILSVPGANMGRARTGRGRRVSVTCQGCVRRELVPNLVYRKNVTWVGWIVFEFAAQFANVGVDRAAPHRPIVPPHLLE